MTEASAPNLNGIKDPRPDLIEDSELWRHTLAAAYYTEKKDLTVYHLLRGFRASGCRLALGKDKKEGIIFKFGTEVTPDDRARIKKFGNLYRTRISSIFTRVYNGIEKFEEDSGSPKS